MRARTVFLVFSTIAICASVLVGAGVLALPPTVGVCLAFYALFVVPGIAIDCLIFHSRGGPLEAVCRISMAGIVFASLVVCLGFIPGLSYRVMSPVAGACAIALLFAGLAAPAMRERHAVSVDERGAAGSMGRFGGRELAAVLVLFAACFFLFYKSGDLGWSTDSLDHVSYLRRSVETGAIFPRDSFYREGDGVSFDIRKGLWHPVLSLWAFQSRTAPDVLWRLIPTLFSFTALSSFLFFGVELLGSAPYALAGLLFMLLFCGGEGAQWLTKLGYGRSAMQVLFWANGAFLLRYFRLRDARYLAAVFFVSAAACAFHVVFAMLAAVFLFGVLLYVLFSREGRLWRGAFLRSVVVEAAALAIPLAVRARAMGAPLNEIHTHRQAMLLFSRGLAMVDPAEIIAREGVVFFFALAMLPFFFLIARPQRRTLVFTLTIVPILLVVNPFIAPILERRFGYLHYRLLDAAPLMFFLVLAAGGLAALIFRGGRLWSLSVMLRRLAAALIIAIFIWYPLRFSASQLAASVEGIVHARAETESRLQTGIEELARRIPVHSVVVSDPLTSYLVSAYTDNFVVAVPGQHGSPTDTMALERIEVVRDIMSPVSPLSASAPWLRRWGAGYLLLNTELPGPSDFFASVRPEELPLAAEKFRSCPRALQMISAAEGLVLYVVLRDSLGPEADSCTVPMARPLPCDTSDAGAPIGLEAGCGVFLDRLAIRSSSVAAGDTLEGHFCWRATEKIAFGLPIALTIRIETGFPKGRCYRDWYGKQYRRHLERSAGVFYRHTWSELLVDGLALPDQWEPGRLVRQDFALAVPEWMAPGRYEFRVKISRTPYLPNRTVADYLSNDDSFEGTRAGTITVGAARQVPRASSGAAAGVPGER